jgi:hypothetical protein
MASYDLTRRRDPDRIGEAWLIFYGDVHVGTIAERSGIPQDGSKIELEQSKCTMRDLSRAAAAHRIVPVG